MYINISNIFYQFQKLSIAEQTSSGPRKMHINPKFANRPLPAIPPPKPARNSLARSQSFSPSVPQQQQKPKEPLYAKLDDPSLKIDLAKKDTFEASIKKTVESNKVLVNPNFSGTVVRRRAGAGGGVPVKPMRHSLMVTSDVAKHLDLQLKKVKSSACVTPKTSVNKENLPSTSKTKMNLFTPLRKSAFKKIGSRKLIRRKSGSPGTPKASFKKIGNKKLIRIVTNASDNENKSANSYDVKTKTKIIKNVKNTPSNAAKYKFSFITPLSLRKSRTRGTANSGSIKKSSGKKSISRFRSRFKLDKRQKVTKTEPKVLFQGSGQSRLKKMSGSTYRVSATKLSKVTSSKVQHPSLTNNKVITVQGVKFSVADNGRKLRRVPSTSGGSTCPPRVTPSRDTGYSASVSASNPTTMSSSSPQTDTTSAPRISGIKDCH